MFNRCLEFSKILTLLSLFLFFASPLLAADVKARARELVNSSGCKGCHKIHGQGGEVGPALDHVGQKLTPEQIRRKLVNPKSENASSMMPSYAYLPEKDLNTLVDYLAKLR